MVDRYVHLGTVVTQCGSAKPDADRNAASMTSAFCPLALRVFGSHHLALQVRMSLLSSLLLTKGLFNAHVYGHDHGQIKSLNIPYMRALRRITGHMRFGEATISDIEMRKLANMPAIDCLLTRARLKYARRVFCYAP